MAVDVHALGIDRLSVGERLQLIDLIWESLPAQIDPADVPAWHLAELAQRRADAAASPGVGKPWPDVLDRHDSPTPVVHCPGMAGRNR